MRDRDLLALEFDKVLHLLAGCALSSAGHEACLTLSPQTARAAVEADSERTWQFFRLLEEHLSVPLRQFPDIRSSLEWAAHIGAALEGQKAPAHSGGYRALQNACILLPPPDWRLRATPRLTGDYSCRFPHLKTRCTAVSMNPAS